MENSEDKAENEREEVIHGKKKNGLAEVILELKRAHHGVFCPSPCGDAGLC